MRTTVLPRTPRGRALAAAYLLLVALAYGIGVSTIQPGPEVGTSPAEVAMPLAVLLCAPLALVTMLVDPLATSGIGGDLAPSPGRLAGLGAFLAVCAVLNIAAATRLSRVLPGTPVLAAAVPRTILGRCLAGLHLLWAFAGVATVVYDDLTYDGSGGASFAGVYGMFATFPTSLLTVPMSTALTAPLEHWAYEGGTGAALERCLSTYSFSVAVVGAALVNIALVTLLARLLGTARARR